MKFQRLRDLGRKVSGQRESNESETVATAPPPSLSDEPIAYGIDFGTTNSQISVAYRDDVRVVDVEGGDLGINVPSLVYLHRNANRAAGRSAIEPFLITGGDRTGCSKCDRVTWTSLGPETDCRQFRQGGGCNDSRLLAGIKSELADKHFHETHSWGVSFSPPELVTVVLRRLKQAADRQTGCDVRRAVLGHPVWFVGAEGPGSSEAQTVAKARLVEAAGEAGFEEVTLLPEPSAVLEDEPLEQGTIVAIDFGGGTFDVAVIEMPRRPGEVTGLAGTAIGGEHFDAVLFQEKVAPELGLRGDYLDDEGKWHKMPARVPALLRNLRGATKLLNDPYARAPIREFQRYQEGDRLAVIEEILLGGFAYDFYRAIEKAKIRLSTEENTEIRLERGRTLDLRIPLDRSEFEIIVEPYLASLEKTIFEALDDAGTDPERVDLVVRTGGSSSIPAFRQRLNSIFGGDKVQMRGPFDAVVNGLAEHARRIW